MADISFYKYLEAAFRYRLFNPTGKTATLNTKFNYLGYNFPYNRIFYYARRLLPKFYTGEFPDTEEGNLALARKVLEKLEKQQDKELENQFKGVTVLDKHQAVLQQVSTESQAGAGQAPTGEPAGAVAGGLPFGIPTAGSYGSGRGVVKPPSPPQPKPETPKSELVVANKSGVVVEKPETPSKLYIADKSGRVVGEKTIGSEAAKPPAQSKLYVANKSGIITGERNIKLPSRFNFSSFKNLGSRAGVFFQRNVGKFLTLGRAATGIGAIIGGFAGAGLTGGSSLGVLGGAIGGGILPSWVRSGGAGRFFGNIGNGGINAFYRFSNQVSGPRFLGGGASKRIVWIFLGVFLLFTIGAGLLGALTGTTPTGEASPIGPVIGTDISSCKFVRGQENPKEASFKSNLLLSHIQEASQKSTIPPVVLAAFIRVESPSSSNMSDEQIANYSAKCGRSKTGALGIMQIQPPGTTSVRGDPASCDDCIDAGAKLVGKTVSSLTQQDYCDPRTNVIVGAGWILKKMSKLGYGDGTKWNPDWTKDRKAIEAMVEGYYGCLKYGKSDINCNDPGNIYNYADDMTASIQNCQASSATVPPPPPNGDLNQAINNKFGISFQSTEFTTGHLQAAWEVLNQAQQVAPKFFGLLGRGITVTTHSDTSERSGNTIYFSTKPGSFFMTGTPQQFKVLLIHELGHVIRGDTGSTKANSYDRQLQSAVNQDALKNRRDGYLTGYGKNPCYGTQNIDEDFAETVTYYVNRGAKEEDLGCGVKSTNGLNPLESGLYPAHLTFIKSVLGEP